MPRFLIIFILIALFFLLPGQVMADEVILGTVFSLNRKAGVFIIKTPESLGFKADSPAKIQVRISPENLPKNMGQGSVVRMWGQYVKKNPPVFEARSVKIRYCGCGHKNDPTGVRSRLGRGRWKRGHQ